MNVYTFGPDEQEISCCSCLLTPNSVADLGVNRDLTNTTLTGVAPGSVVGKAGSDVLERNLPQRERIGPRPGPQHKGPARDEDYKEWIRTLACCACGVERRSEAAHTGTDGGMSMKASDYSCVPMCPECHTQAPGAYHRIGKRAFEASRGLSFVALVAQLQGEWRRKCA